MGREKFMGKKLLIFLSLAIILFVGEQRLSGQVFLISIRSEGPTDICQGDPVTLILTVYGGDPPYTVTINSDDGEYMVLKDIEMPYKFEVYPESDNTFYIASAVDSRDRKGRAYGSVTVHVNPSTPVSILLDRTAYLVTEPGVPLKSDPSGGHFSGIGVSGNIFYPSVAGTAGSPHLITCTYENEWGCTSKDTEYLYVLSGVASVSLVSGGDPVYSFCNDGSGYTIIGDNDDDLTGSFELFLKGTSTPVPDHISDPDPDDDMATLLTEGLSGNYEIVYTYGIGGLEIEASTEFEALDINLNGIQGLPETACKKDDPYPLQPDVGVPDPNAIFSFSGPGISGNQSTGFYFDPGDPEVPADLVEIELDYTASNGCNMVLSEIIFVGIDPEVNFRLDPICMAPQGGTVFFENLTPGKGSVETWSWNFGDPASGNDNTSDLVHPDHYYTSPGPRTITLTATSYEGCTGQLQLDTVLVDNPVPDFTFKSDCFTEGKDISFTASSVSIYSVLDTMIWTVISKEGDILENIGKGPQDLTMNYLFPSVDDYDINLYVQNLAGCAGEITKRIGLVPSYPLTVNGYTETFNQPVAGWVVASVDQQESWVLGEPDFNGFESEENDHAWYTDLPAYSEEVIEHSWVRSPCFDFSGIRNPVIGMDIIKSFEPGKGGAVLQYQETAGDPWLTLGFLGGGSNWYNQSSIVYLPGGSSIGWGLETFEPDHKWVPASHPAQQLGGKPHLKFRIAFASGGAREIEPGIFNQGFAFDNFTVSESMNRRSVLEYFTNAAGEPMFVADSLVKGFATKYSGIVYDLHYHMDYPEEDPMNAYNPYAPSTRAFNYGVPTVPYAVLNGGVTPAYRYNLVLPDGALDEELLLESALEAPQFDLSLAVDFGGDLLNGNVQVTCLSDSFDANIQLYVVVLEKEVTSYPELSEDGSFRNVVLDMVPSPTGKLLGNNWNDGKTEEMDFSWEYVPYIEDPEDLFVVAFVQDRDHGAVLQADAVYYSTYTGIAEYKNRSVPLVLYPNPATDYVTVYFGERTALGGELEIVDISGRKVMVTSVQKGITTQELDISRLPEGMFMITWTETGTAKGHARLIRIR
jgi:PKD repeat protein